MVRCGNRERPVTTNPLVCDKQRIIVFEQQLSVVFFKTHGPIKRMGLLVAPCISAQIMYDIAATDDQDAFLPERPIGGVRSLIWNFQPDAEPKVRLSIPA